MIVLRPPIQHPYHQRKIVFMSGLSNPNNCQLSKVQISFFEQLCLSPPETMLTNFPYLIENQAEIRSPSLLTASINNGKQFLFAQRSPYKEAAIAHWQSLVESCSELIVITLSCGLEILNVCCSTGIQPNRLHVIALGPVAKKRPQTSHQLIRGGRDFVALPFFPSVDIIVPNVGHMDYLENESVLQIVNDVINT